MRLLKLFPLIAIQLILTASDLFAINELVARVPDVYTSKPAYIDKAMLEIEPHGAYSEQSLYLQYSDHNQFLQGQKVEIIQRFELPPGSVVNDLWLWIDNVPEKALCIDTWTARAIYEKIVSMKRDPAFLTKKGDQYELHIYPLDPGSFRKIKLNFITPTRWLANGAAIELPLLMLKCNNNKFKPLEVLFRTKQNVWGEPGFMEDTLLRFGSFFDSAGYKYKRLNLGDISQFASLKLTYKLELNNGVYFNSYRDKDNLTYFQSSFHLKDVFGLGIDSTSKKNLIGIDLSGGGNKNYSTLIPALKKLFKSTLKPNDYFNMVVSGAGSTKKIFPAWTAATPGNIDSTLNSFAQSKFADSIAATKLPALIYCDANSPLCWGFTGVEYYANIKKYVSIFQATESFGKSDIVVSYEQGFERVPSANELPKIFTCLDTLFLNGGRFLTYFDFNRDSRHEPVATHYINGLSTRAQYKTPITLYRNTNGNIGADFPESIIHSGTYTLKYNDQDVKVELQDKDGNPVVISKRIGNGLIVVSGMWSFNDDAPLRKLLTVPLLGLSHSKVPSLLENTYIALKDEYIKSPFDKALMISNSDSLILQQDAQGWAASYSAGFSGASRPVFNSINLLDGSVGVPPSVTVNNITYYGSGYLMKTTDDNMRGIHLETHLNDWDIISLMLTPFAIPAPEQLSVEAYADNKPEKITEIKEIKQDVQDNSSPRFFIGSASAAVELKFNISARFSGSDSLKKRTYTFPVNKDTLQTKSIIAEMLTNETIKGYFALGALDTAKIIQLALKHNLLCDYTALLALEPNDTNRYIKNNPAPKGGGTSVVKDESRHDSSGFSVYPNPFNSRTKISVKVKSPAKINLFIYNIIGQLIRTIARDEEIISTGSYYWDGKDSCDRSVSSGIYIARAELKEMGSNKTQAITRKLLLLK